MHIILYRVSIKNSASFSLARLVHQDLTLELFHSSLLTIRPYYYYDGGVAYLTLLASSDVPLCSETVERFVGGGALVSPLKVIPRAGGVYNVELPVAKYTQ